MADLGDVLERLADEVAHAIMRISELERRNDNTIRHGKVTDVDTKRQLARLEIGEKDGIPLKSAWVPYAQVAGAYKFHNPPSKGQQMTLFAPNGEVRQAVLLPFTWWDENRSPSDKEDEHVITFGDLRLTRKEDSYSMSVGESVIDIGKDKITIYAEKVSISKATYIGQKAKGDTKGEKVDISDGIAAKQAFTIPE